MYCYCRISYNLGKVKTQRNVLLLFKSLDFYLKNAKTEVGLKVRNGISGCSFKLFPPSPKETENFCSLLHLIFLQNWPLYWMRFEAHLFDLRLWRHISKLRLGPFFFFFNKLFCKLRSRNFQSSLELVDSFATYSNREMLLQQAN